MTTTPEPTCVFVSHSSKNDDIITRLHNELEEKTGADIWVDHIDIDADHLWEDEVESNLRSRPYCLVCISKQSVASKEVRSEWRGAITYGHKLLLAVIDDIKTEDIPPRLLLHQMIWLTDGKWDDGIANLVKAIQKGTESPHADEPRFSRITTITGTIPRNLTRIAMQGRESDLADVRAGLEKGDITAIIGVGGLGKSRLAAEVVGNSDARGIVWHRIRDITSAENVVTLLRKNLDLPPITECDDAIKQFGEQQRLLVLDNGEDAKSDRLTEYAKLADEINRAGAQVLITSRVMWDELDMATEVHPETLTLEAAAKVVAEMATAYNVSVPEIEHEAIATEARQHPWLIEWAIKQMKRLPVQRVLALLQTPDAKRIQEAVYQVIGKTVEQMSEESTNAAELLSWVTVFRGGFTYDTAEFVCQSSEIEDFETALETLQKYAFVSFDATTQRYSVDSFVLEVIETNMNAHKPHYDYYYAKAREHKNSNDHMTYAKLDVESDNLEAAFEWALAIDDGDSALRLMNECNGFMINRGRFQIIIEWATKVTMKLKERNDNLRLLAASQNTLAQAYRRYPQGSQVRNLQKAILIFQEALLIRTVETSPRDFAITQNNLGNAYLNLSRYQDPEMNLQKAITAYENALTFYTTKTSPSHYATIQNNLGNAYAHLTRFMHPETNLQKAISSYE
ncbi:MAG: toll/interleukin-1 receptor domain-containing protein, partial [Anaerolineae bacterium]|nr:toll/interleukin-1 receptor domain-containing protein [Anaerolineae bacterium]